MPNLFVRHCTHLTLPFTVEDVSSTCMMLCLKIFDMMFCLKSLVFAWNSVFQLQIVDSFRLKLLLEYSFIISQSLFRGTVPFMFKSKTRLLIFLPYETLVILYLFKTSFGKSSPFGSRIYCVSETTTEKLESSSCV